MVLFVGLALAFGLWIGVVGAGSAGEDVPPVQRPRAVTEAHERSAAEAVPGAPTGGEPTAPAEPVGPPAEAAATEPISPAAPARSPADPAPAPPARPPPTPEPTDPVASEGTPAVGPTVLRRHDERRFRHHGGVISLAFGPQGCSGSFCSRDRHDVVPGPRIAGFVGGNIRGFVELGLGGGWGQMGARVQSGSAALPLLGIDPAALATELQAVAIMTGVNLAAVTVTSASLRMAQLGPRLRVHVVPRGRMLAYVGTGAMWSMVRARYQTNSGDARVDLHGIAVPIEAAIGVHVHERIALALAGEWMWTWTGLLSMHVADADIPMPTSLLRKAGVDPKRDMPHAWSVTLGLRATL